MARAAIELVAALAAFAGAAAPQGQSPLHELRQCIGATRDCGAGFAVVVIDDGVAPDQTRELTGRVVAGGFHTVTRPWSGPDHVVSGWGDAALGAPQHTKARELSHGTQVASIVAGIASDPDHPTRGVSIIGLRVADRWGKIRLDDILGALRQVRDHWIEEYDGRAADRPKIAAVITCLSWPGGTRTDCASAPLATEVEAVIEDLWSRDVPVVVSAGNDGDDEHLPFPACLPRTIAVAATENLAAVDGRVPAWANSNFCASIDVAAPGKGIRLGILARNGAWVTTPIRAGTSVAAPQVAAAIAILRERNDRCGAEQWCQALRSSQQRAVRGDQLRPFLRIDQALAFLAGRCGPKIARRD